MNWQYPFGNRHRATTRLALVLCLAVTVSDCAQAPVAPTPVTRRYLGTVSLYSTTPGYPDGRGGGGYGHRYDATVNVDLSQQVAIFTITLTGWLLATPQVTTMVGPVSCELKFLVSGDVSSTATFSGSDFMHACWGASKWTIEGVVDESAMKGRINMRHEDYGPFTDPIYDQDTGWVPLLLTRQ